MRRQGAGSAGLAWAAATLILACAAQAAGATELPRGEPPQPAAKRINVADLGARLADDDFDDTPAVNAAIKAATIGGWSM